jgi:hypothetical protein
MNPYTILGAILLLVATAFGGISAGKKLERAEWQKEKIVLQAQQQAQVEAQFRQFDQQVKINDAKARKAADTYEDAITQLTHDAAADVAAVKRAGGLRITAPARACKSTAAAESAGPSQPDETGTETLRLPVTIEDGLFDLANDADEVSEQLRALQAWVRDNGHYGQTE